MNLSCAKLDWKFNDICGDGLRFSFLGWMATSVLGDMLDSAVVHSTQIGSDDSHKNLNLF